MTTHSAEVSPRAVKLWARLSEWYGTRLVETYGPVPPRDWCRLVDRSNNGDIKRALATIRLKHPSHPPTLPEFEAALKPAVPAHRDAAAPTVQERLVAHVTATQQLTRQQLRSTWTWLYRRAQWTDGMNRSRDELAECIGVVIPADGDIPSVRVMAEDLSMPAIAA